MLPFCVVDGVTALDDTMGVFSMTKSVRKVFAAVYVAAYVPHIHRNVGLRKNFVGCCSIVTEVRYILVHTVMRFVAVVAVGEAAAVVRSTNALSMMARNGAAMAVTVTATRTSPTNFVASTNLFFKFSLAYT